MKRSLSVRLIGQDIAEDRRRFRLAVSKWPEFDLRESLARYEFALAGNPSERGFYLPRIRAVHNELKRRNLGNAS
jgi:hypothetical protein